VYSRAGFPKGFDHHLALIVHADRDYNVFVCHSDYAHCHERGLEWCDLYAKVNVDLAAVPDGYRERILPLGPSFGMQIYRPLHAFYRALRSFRPGDANPREHFANYYRQFRYCVPEETYEPCESATDYVFFAGSLWIEEPDTNLARMLFIKACRRVDRVQFEGGFIPRRNHVGDPVGFETLTVERPYPITDYIARIKRSAVVFNTPAVGRCHGWKLGEFLALGKAIVSTPLTRMLPAPLVHGQHVHYVEPAEDAMKEAVERIVQDTGYRASLERSARAYYEEYLRPAAVVSRIVREAIASHRSQRPS
jgi:glycosyltransferase involved in cell wall biosynthesis